MCTCEHIRLLNKTKIHRGGGEFGTEARFLMGQNAGVSPAKKPQSPNNTFTSPPRQCNKAGSNR
jgi:hypothetical protein